VTISDSHLRRWELDDAERPTWSRDVEWRWDVLAPASGARRLHASNPNVGAWVIDAVSGTDVSRGRARGVFPLPNGEDALLHLAFGHVRITTPDGAQLHTCETLNEDDDWRDYSLLDARPPLVLLGTEWGARLMLDYERCSVVRGLESDDARRAIRSATPFRTAGALLSHRIGALSSLRACEGSYDPRIVAAPVELAAYSSFARSPWAPPDQCTGSP
jgi:hypothetical protein